MTTWPFLLLSSLLPPGLERNYQHHSFATRRVLNMATLDLDRSGHITRLEVWYEYRLDIAIIVLAETAPDRTCLEYAYCLEAVRP